MSENKELLIAIAKFQSEAPIVKFDASIKYGGRPFKYATLSSVIECIRPTLTKLKLGFTQVIQDGLLKTILFNDKGQTLESSYQLPSISKPQDLGSWVTYIKRYQLCAMLGIVGEEDNDGNGTANPADAAKQAVRVKLKSISKVEDLTKLYKDNEKYISQDAKLLAEFTNKKKSLNGSLV